MNTFNRKAYKKRGIKRFFSSFKYALQGIKFAFNYEQNFLVHLLVTVLVITLGFVFKITGLEWTLLFIAISLVLGTEMLNTAIEAMIDLYSLEKKELSKVAKDSASAAVFIFSLVAVAIGLIVFLPYIIELFRR